MRPHAGDPTGVPSGRRDQAASLVDVRIRVVKESRGTCVETIQRPPWGLQVSHFLGLGERLGAVSGPELDDGR